MDNAEIIRILTADYPAPIWYVPSVILLILGIVSLVDARTGRVPDLPVAVGFVGAVCALAWYAGWALAAVQAAYAIAAVIALRLANNLYYRIARRDAFGFGDAKWTGLAVVGFGVMPVVWAWIVGAWLGVIWIGLRKLIDAVRTSSDGTVYVHFAPFLFLGLIAALFKQQIMTALGVAL